jgi:hypothetical protein
MTQKKEVFSVPKSKLIDSDDESTRSLFKEGKGVEQHKSKPDKKLKHLAKEMLKQEDGHLKPKR